LNEETTDLLRYCGTFFRTYLQHFEDSSNLQLEASITSIENDVDLLQKSIFLGIELRLVFEFELAQNPKVSE
jgi:hypothetical protein